MACLDARRTRRRTASDACRIEASMHGSLSASEGAVRRLRPLARRDRPSFRTRLPMPLWHLRGPLPGRVRTTSPRVASPSGGRNGLTLGHGHRARARMARRVRLSLAAPAGLLDVCLVRTRHRRARGRPSVRRRLFTLCAAHRGGIQVADGRRTRPTGLDPSALQSRLIDTYAVDSSCRRSRCAVVRATGDRPAAVMPSIRVVPVEDEGHDAGVTLSAAWRAIRDGMGDAPPLTRLMTDRRKIVLPRPIGSEWMTVSTPGPLTA